MFKDLEFMTIHHQNLTKDIYIASVKTHPWKMDGYEELCQFNIN